LADNEFITQFNLALIKPASFHDEQHYFRLHTENTLTYLFETFFVTDFCLNIFSDWLLSRRAVDRLFNRKGP